MKKLWNYKKVFFSFIIFYISYYILVINKFILSVAGKSKSCQVAEVIHFQFWSLKEKIDKLEFDKTEDIIKKIKNWFLLNLFIYDSNRFSNRS